MGKKYEKADGAIAIRASLIDQLLMQHGYSMPAPDIIAQAIQLESYIKNGIVMMGAGVGSGGRVEAVIDRDVELTPHVDRGPSADWGTDHQIRPNPVSTDPFARIAERIKRDADKVADDLWSSLGGGHLFDISSAIDFPPDGDDIFLEIGRDEHGNPRIKQVFPKSQQMDRDNRQASKRHIRDELDAALSSALAVLMEFQAKSKVGADPDPDEAFTALADILALMAGRIDSPKTQAAEDGAAAALREEVRK